MNAFLIKLVSSWDVNAILLLMQEMCLALYTSPIRFRGIEISNFQMHKEYDEGKMNWKYCSDKTLFEVAMFKGFKSPYSPENKAY